MLALGTGVVERGFTVDLVVASAHGDLVDGVPPELRLVDLHAGRVATAIIPLSRYLRQARPSWLISAKDHANLVALGAAFLARTQTSVVVTVHGAPSDTLASPDRWTGHVVRRLIKWAYPRAAAVVAVSDGVADDLRLILGNRRARLEVVVNPVITARFLASAHVPVTHPWLSPAEKVPVIAWCGRLADAKDPHTAVASFARLRRSRKARLIVMGDGPLRAPMESLVRQLGLADDVYFAGFVAEPAAYLAHADAFLFSSRNREGLPTVLIEALGVGTPVVATDCPYGPAQILDHGRLGRLVPVGDPIAMASALASVLDHAPAPPTEEDLRPYLADTAIDRYVAIMQGVG